MKNGNVNPFVGVENHVYEMAHRVGLKPHHFESVKASLHHRPNVVVAVVRKDDDKLPLGVGYAFRNPKVKAEFQNLERLALRRAFTAAFPLVRLL
jgi:hypothetical protein